MKHIVVAGGTDGLGRAAALDRLAKGDTVVVIGRNPMRGAEFLAAAEALGGGDRFVLGYEMLDLLAAAPRPLILNVAGPGSGTGQIRWGDLGFAQGYHGLRALSQGGQLNDLLGIEFARRAPAPVRYVLLHPGVVDTGLSGDYDLEMAARVQAMRVGAQSVAQAVRPILDVLNNPPADPLTAIVQGRPLDVRGPAFDSAAAARLFGETTRLLADFGVPSPVGAGES
ncbi:hypothetical protein [Nocardia sp. NPDC050718]|uniref:hypothetical protein n=1 Tax=Nocardia sp. NPDC050718 TaxID=3155788 RepID=UPI0033C04D48